MTIDLIQLGKTFAAATVLAGAGWAGFGWVDVQNRDVEALPPIEKTLQQVGEAVERVTQVQQSVEERAAAQQVIAEMECEKTTSDWPQSYCDAVLREKRIREALRR